MTDIIVSIPHTGTRFLRERLGIMEFVHTIQEWNKLLDDIGDKKIVSPLRSPKACWRSATRRRGNSRPFDITTWVGAWYTMHALTLVRDVDFIILEHQRDPRITDWSKVGHDDAGDLVEREINLEPIYALPFVNSHYSIHNE